MITFSILKEEKGERSNFYYTFLYFRHSARGGSLMEVWDRRGGGCTMVLVYCGVVVHHGAGVL